MVPGCRQVVTLSTCALALLACAAPLRLNDVQVLATHNSYKRHMDPAVMRKLVKKRPALARKLEYGHPPLTEQLARGVRGLELDVYHDPRGGRFAAPRVIERLRARGVALREPFDPEHVLRAPGFKVLHRPSDDLFSHCATLQACLRALRSWSLAHPTHVPIVVLVNVKDELAGSWDARQPGEVGIDAAAWDALDREIVQGLGRDRLITPDDVRGDHETLADAALADDWPELDEVRGKWLFVLDEGREKVASYARGHASLRGRVLFVDAAEGRAESAVRVVNDPLAQREYIRELVRLGYLVRTRSDAHGEESRTGRTERRDAAFESGAHVISTDYVEPDPRHGTGYSVTLPGGGLARCNPLRRARCRIEE